MKQWSSESLQVKQWEKLELKQNTEKKQRKKKENWDSEPRNETVKQWIFTNETVKIQNQKSGAV